MHSFFNAAKSILSYSQEPLVRGSRSSAFDAGKANRRNHQEDSTSIEAIAVNNTLHKGDRWTDGRTEDNAVGRGNRIDGLKRKPARQNHRHCSSEVAAGDQCKLNSKVQKDICFLPSSRTAIQWNGCHPNLTFPWEARSASCTSTQIASSYSHLRIS